MAQPETIDRLLNDLADAYARKPEWVRAVRGPWQRGLGGFSDQVVLAAKEKGLREHEFVPTLKAMVGYCEELGKREVVVPRGCGRCSHGIVDVVRHVDGPRGIVAEELATRCTCPRGQVLSASIATYPEQVARWESSGATLAVYVHPTYEQRHPETVGRHRAWDGRGPQRGRALVAAMTGGVDPNARERQRYLDQDRLREMEEAHDVG